MNIGRNPFTPILHRSSPPDIGDVHYHLTFDVDWAPDWAIMDVLEELDVAGAKGTFFITHETSLLRAIHERGHNLGIHPNFLENSSQGGNATEILKHLIELCPDATCVRTHALVQSSLILHHMFKSHLQLKYDFSMLMYKFPVIEWFDWKFRGAEFKRINYTWEDDIAFYDIGFRWDQFAPWSDKIIFDFHPLQVALNSSTEDNYTELKRRLNGSALAEVKRPTVEEFVSEKPGARTYLKAILASQARPMSFEELICGLD